ncbi:MAG: hypothetical protein GX638_14015 [Crenarchaeota archaeon]|nr:hypothetical protein [Thermoproteota archaeon]
MELTNETKVMTREQWLNAVKDELRPLFLIVGLDIPKVRVSCGFSGKNVRGQHNGKILGVAYNHIISSDDTCEIFISPEIDNGLEVAAILVHELIHACLPNAGHGRDFRAAAIELGLTGKMTSTIATPELNSKLLQIIEKIGQGYPHSRLNLADRPKQDTRLHKMVCTDCGAIAYMTRKWIDSIGTPFCGCGSKIQMECTDKE